MATASFAQCGADKVKKTSEKFCTNTLWVSLVKLIYTDAVIVLTSVVSLN
jgi:hypothetical protein